MPKSSNLKFGNDPNVPGRGEFTDAYGQLCMIKPSSAVGSYIHLGAYDKGPHMKEPGVMHLSQAMVIELLPYLTAFAETGSLDVRPGQRWDAERAQAREALDRHIGQLACELRDEGYNDLAAAFELLIDPRPDNE